MEIANNLWIEKFRPKKFENLVLPDTYKKEFQYYIDEKELGNLLFSGPPGSGKTTLARILCSKNGVIQYKNDNVLFVNGSAKETRNIGFVHSVIEPFLKIPPAGNDKYKVVFIDEVDQFTSDGFLALRGIIEKYHEKYGRFLFTCNYISKVPEAVQSRFTSYTFQQIPKNFVLSYCKKILELEKIEYDDDKNIHFIINNLYPDIRKIVNVLQRCSITKKLIVDEKSVTTTEKIILSSVVEIVSSIEKDDKHKLGKSVNSIIELLSKHDIEFRGIYTNLFFMKNLPIPAKIIVNKKANEHQNCLIPHMHFMSMVFEIIKALQDYKWMLTK